MPRRFLLRSVGSFRGDDDDDASSVISTSSERLNLNSPWRKVRASAKELIKRKTLVASAVAAFTSAGKSAKKSTGGEAPKSVRTPTSNGSKSPLFANVLTPPTPTGAHRKTNARKMREIAARNHRRLSGDDDQHSGPANGHSDGHRNGKAKKPRPLKRTFSPRLSLAGAAAPMASGDDD